MSRRSYYGGGGDGRVQILAVGIRRRDLEAVRAALESDLPLELLGMIRLNDVPLFPPPPPKKTRRVARLVTM